MVMMIDDDDENDDRVMEQNRQNWYEKLTGISDLKDIYIYM